MSDKRVLNEIKMTSNTDNQTIPPIVGHYRRPLSEEFVPKVIPLSHQLKSLAEKKLKRFYKCTKFNLKSGGKSDQCFAAKNYRSAYVQHLRDKHPKQCFWCIYCYPKPNIDERQVKPTLYSATDLVEHMNVKHRYRLFQCNLCFYRAISAEHVNIHQRFVHKVIHEKTVRNKQFEGKCCKILVCSPISAEPLPPLCQPYDHYSRYAFKQINIGPKEGKNYQCLYCENLNVCKDLVIGHCIQTHPDYHILYYNCDPEVRATESPERGQQLTEIDLFKANSETQVNRVSSTKTDPMDAGSKGTKRVVNEYVKDNAFLKKPRISHLQSEEQKTSAGLSRKSLNKDPVVSTYVPKGPAAARMEALAPNRPLHWKPNQRRPMPASKRKLNQELQTLKQKMENRMEGRLRYESDDSSDDMPKRVAKKQTPGQRPPNRPGFPPNRQQLSTIGRTNTFQRPVSPPNDVPSRKAFVKSKHMSSDRWPSPPLKKRRSPPPPSRRPVSPAPRPSSPPRKPSTAARHPLPSTSSAHKRFKVTESAVKTTKTQISKPIAEQNVRNKSKPKKRLQHLTSSEEEEEDDESGSEQHMTFVERPSRLPSGLNDVIKRYTKPSHRHSGNDKSRRDSVKRVDIKSSDEYESDVESIPETDDSDLRPTSLTPSRKTTTIERAESESEESDREVEIIPKFICLFCDYKAIDENKGVEHLETHFPDMSRAIDDYKTTKRVQKWFRHFFDIQKKDDLFKERVVPIDNVEHPYKCPICDKMAELRNKKAKRYKNYWEMKVHFYEHTGWTPNRCLFCTGEHWLTNCDQSIVNHLNTNHCKKMVESDNEFIRVLVGNKVKNDCSPEERQALELEEMIEFNRYEGLDSKIECCLKEISESRLRRLRRKNECKKLPFIPLQPLPALNYDDSDMIVRYLSDCERRVGVEDRDVSPQEFVVSDEDSNDEDNECIIKERPTPTKAPEADSVHKRYQCSHCGLQFVDRKRAKSHINESHPKLAMSFKSVFD